MNSTITLSPVDQRDSCDSLAPTQDLNEGNLKFFRPKFGTRNEIQTPGKEKDTSHCPNSGSLTERRASQPAPFYCWHLPHSKLAAAVGHGTATAVER